MKATKIDVRRSSGKRSRVYIFPKGESLIENLMNRKGRPYNEYRKQVMPDVLEAMGLPRDTKVKWSQYAGCSCPCSPGFIVPGWNQEVFVDVEAV